MPRLADTLARLGARRAPMPAEEKASATGPLIVLETLGRPAWTPRDYEAFAREGFMQNAIVYRAVRMISEAAASVPLLLFEGDQEHDDHPLLDLLARPSLDQTGADFLEAWYGYLLVAGNAYAEAVALDGRVRELHALRPDRMKVVPGAEGWPEAYEYTCAGRTVRFEEEPVPGVRPILHVRLFHPVHDHYGMSPIEAAAQAIDIHNTAGRWNKALLDNSARPSGALVYGGADGRMTAEQFERLKAELEDGFQGPRRAGRPLLLEGGLDWKPLSLSPKDMDFIAARNGAAREIALAFGVPPMLLGIPGDNTYSNYQEAQRAFWRSTVLPLVTRTAKALSSWLAPAWEVLPKAGNGSGSGKPSVYPGRGQDRLELRPDVDQIEALSGEREALWARIEKVSFLTLNEKRQAVGYAPLEEAEPAAVAPDGDVSAVTGKYNPNQPRAPRGTSDGGQWVDEGGNGSPSRGSSASTPARDGRSKEEFVRLADASEVEAVRSRYSPDKPGWHDYGTENEVCPAEWQCSPEEMADQLPRFAFPGQDPARPAESGSLNPVVDPTTGITAGNVRTFVTDDGRTVVNITLPDHILHDGMVERRAVQQSDGSWKVQTQGIGNNETPGMNVINNLFGPEIFDALDERLRENIGAHRGKKAQGGPGYPQRCRTGSQRGMARGGQNE
jgi:HK97 family phage portal protein